MSRNVGATFRLIRCRYSCWGEDSPVAKEEPLVFLQDMKRSQSSYDVSEEEKECEPCDENVSEDEQQDGHDVLDLSIHAMKTGKSLKGLAPGDIRHVLSTSDARKSTEQRLNDALVDHGGLAGKDVQVIHRTTKSVGGTTTMMGDYDCYKCLHNEAVAMLDSLEDDSNSTSKRQITKNHELYEFDHDPGEEPPNKNDMDSHLDKADFDTVEDLEDDGAIPDRGHHDVVATDTVLDFTVDRLVYKTQHVASDGETVKWTDTSSDAFGMKHQPVITDGVDEPFNHGELIEIEKKPPDPLELRLLFGWLPLG